MKKLAGYPVEKLECWAVKSHYQIVHQRLHNPQDDILVSILAQRSVKAGGAAMAMPTKEYLQSGSEDDWFTEPQHYLATSQRVAILALPGLRYHRAVGDKLVKTPHFLTVLR